MMGYITLNQEIDVEIDVDDIVSNLNSFNKDELIELQDEIDFHLNKYNLKKKEDVLEASTLDEEYKIKILKEMFDKFSWEELEEIKKKII